MLKFPVVVFLPNQRRKLNHDVDFFTINTTQCGFFGPGNTLVLVHWSLVWLS